MTVRRPTRSQWEQMAREAAPAIERARGQIRKALTGSARSAMGAARSAPAQARKAQVAKVRNIRKQITNTGGKTRVGNATRSTKRY